MHDIGKAGCYEEYYQNKKVYSNFGSKSDELGKFDWFSVKAYKYKDSKDRMCFGSHGQESEYLARCFIPLTMEESCAIIHHMGNLDSDASSVEYLLDIYARHPLAAILHSADFIASYLTKSETDS